MSGAIFEHAHEQFFHGKKVRELAHMSAITLTHSNDQHL
jgi:hypothetical protein